ncbi:hypothetical protein CRG98_018443 [Punica granatum]|uniref:Uncharacterized protein n=1 Tax=Punica granatum TaxID=22663 RepID=A0A2I0JZ85_PUNGR|nr:hypothetical protein CRG98_018443 [Punica granatum]
MPLLRRSRLRLSTTAHLRRSRLRLSFKLSFPVRFCLFSVALVSDSPLQRLLSIALVSDSPSSSLSRSLALLLFVKVLFL